MYYKRINVMTVWKPTVVFGSHYFMTQDSITSWSRWLLRFPLAHLFSLSLTSFFFRCKFPIRFSQNLDNEQWMEWLRLWRNGASLSLLIKLSAWCPIRGTKAWNCLTFFSPCAFCHRPFPRLHFTARRKARAPETCFVPQGFVWQRVV